jgi:hypothetical protein
MRLAVIMCVAMFSSGVLGAQPAFVGSWKLISYESFSLAGEVSYPLGKDAIGRINYDAAGRMSVQIMRPGRPQMEGLIRTGGTPEQVITAYRGYTAYYGVYTVDEARSVVIHKVEGSLFPNYVGTDQVRHYSFSGKRLTLQADLQQGGRSKLVWEKLP